MIVDGKKLAQEILEELKEERKKIAKKIRLAVVLVGENPASLSFIKQKEKIAKELDIEFSLHQYPQEIKTKELRKYINQICKSKINRGVVVQLPLPAHILTQSVLNAVLPHKDPDVLCERNLGKFYTGRLEILPPTVGAAKFILDKYQIQREGKNVLIIGRGQLVGKPLALWFIKEGSTVLVANSKSKNLKELTKWAEIIVSSAGVQNLIQKEDIQEGAVILDMAIVSENGQIKGDCCFDSVKEKAGLITPVPGGVGPLTVAFLYKNLLYLVKNSKK